LKTIVRGRSSSPYLAEQGYGIVETLVVVSIISVFALVVISRYERTVLEARKTALHAELVNIRQAIIFFKITRGRYPDSLQELTTEKVILPYADEHEVIFRGGYLQHQAVDDKNNLLDPFGKPYNYVRASGNVNSTERGFESW
jgi:type II secretory pathway pseudopilin PulG